MEREGHLTKLGIDMELDERVSCSMSVANGRVNVVSDNAIINATINHGINLAELAKLINDVRNAMGDDLSSEDTETINVSLKSLETELQQEKPRADIVRNKFAAIQAIESTEFSAAVVHLFQFVSDARRT